MKYKRREAYTTHILKLTDEELGVVQGALMHLDWDYIEDVTGLTVGEDLWDIDLNAAGQKTRDAMRRAPFSGWATGPLGKDD